MLLKRGHFSHSNPRLADQIEKHFPECDLEVIDVDRELIYRDPRFLIGGAVQALRVYGREAILRRRPFAQCFYRTAWTFDEVRNAVRRRLSAMEDNIAFTIQSQSLYDASSEGIPHFVYTDHTHLANLRYPGFDVDRLYAREWIEREGEIYRNARATFVMGSHVRRSLIEDYGVSEEQAECIFAGSNVDPAPIRLENDGFANQTIVFIGVDWHRKGGPVLVKAFESVVKRLPSARLIIIGCEPPVTHPQIQVVGCIPKREVKQWLARSSVFCMPTRLEPFGIAVIEAFHHGLPVVATNIGAIPDLVKDGETGRLVSTNDSEALATALVDLLGDPECCRRYGEEGRKRVESDYTWDAVGTKLAEGIRARLPYRVTGASC